jgi:hypothetical protein
MNLPTASGNDRKFLGELSDCQLIKDDCMELAGSELMRFRLLKAGYRCFK